MELKHKHLLVRAEVLDPPKDLKMMRKWTKNLIKDIDMKILAGPYAKYCDVKGNRGLTCVTIIETSHITLHSWDEMNPALVQLDVYTCGPFEPQSVLDLLQELKPTKVEFKYLDREKGFTELTI